VAIDTSSHDNAQWPVPNPKHSCDKIYLDKSPRLIRAIQVKLSSATQKPKCP